jgi:HPt (histidine-containing phosphotransfer) domain-containing protein
MPYDHIALINEADLAVVQREIGPALPRIFGYYRQDGVTSITAIEDAMAERNATAMILPAHSLKGESRQFGAERMAEIAEHLETTARQCVEDRTALPDALAVDVGMMRACFHETVTQLESKIMGAAPPPRAAPARPVFGRRVAN